MKKVTNQVQWYEGMLLEPQHFQEESLSIRQLSLYYLKLANPYFWGLSNLTIDEVALHSGKIRITEMLGVFPDGGLIQVLPDDASYPELDLSTIKDLDKTKTTTIYIATPRYRPDAANTETDFPRYASVQEGPIVDRNTGKAEVYMPKLDLNLSIIIGEQVPTRYIAFPLAQIIYKDDGFVLKDFIPPMVNIMNGTPLNTLCTRLINSLRSKINFLSSKLKSPLGINNSPLLARYAEISSIITPLVPKLESFVFAQTTHPFLVYTELCFIAGKISTMVSGQIPPMLAPYQHDNLLATFTPVLKFIDDMIATVKQLSIPVPFQMNNDVFTLNLQKTWVWENKLVIGISHNTAASPNDTKNWLDNAIISTDDHVNNAKEMRVLGANRTSVSQIPDLGLIISEGMTFATIEVDPSFITLDHKLMIFNSSDTEETRPLEISLYVTDAKGDDDA